MRTGNIDGNINNLYQVVYDSGELEAATDSVTISDLDGDTDHEYELICRFVNDDASDAGYYIRFNGDTAGNYGVQYLRGNDTSHQAGVNTSDNQIYLATSNAAQNYLTFATCHIYAAKNDIRLTLGRCGEDMDGTTPTIVSNISGSWDNKVDNMTSLTVASTQTSGIGVGSRIILLRKTDATDGMRTGEMQVEGDVENVWQRIYETSIESATTSVTISDLNGNSDVLYKLICMFRGGSGSNTTYNVRFNGDTGNNYGRQHVGGNVTTELASRDTSQSLIIICTSSMTTSHVMYTDTIFYAKSGYERCGITEDTAKVDATTVASAGTQTDLWSNTGDEITSMTVLANQTNGIGIGSQIELWKLNL